MPGLRSGRHPRSYVCLTCVALVTSMNRCSRQGRLTVRTCPRQLANCSKLVEPSRREMRWHWPNRGLEEEHRNGWRTQDTESLFDILLLLQISMAANGATLTAQPPANSFISGFSAQVGKASLIWWWHHHRARSQSWSEQTSRGDRTDDGSSMPRAGRLRIFPLFRCNRNCMGTVWSGLFWFTR